MDLFVSTGLRDAGYDTVGTDDCWAYSRDPTTGVIIPDPATFPSGMKALADYAHARGLKFGLYSSNSPLTCDRRPGSWGYEVLDAQTYASWGVCACPTAAARAIRARAKPANSACPKAAPLPLHAPWLSIPSSDVEIRQLR